LKKRPCLLNLPEFLVEFKNFVSPPCTIAARIAALSSETVRQLLYESSSTPFSIASRMFSA
jgi:hypothetical protein